MSTLSELIDKEKVRESGPVGLFRKKAGEKFTSLGLPTKKSDPFAYMPLLKLYDAQLLQESLAASAYGDIAFHNGCFQEKTVDGVECMKLEDGIKKYGMFLSQALKKGIESEENPFALLNMQLHDEGAFVYIPPNAKTSTPLTITQHVETPTAFSKVLVLVGRGACVDLKIEAPHAHEKSFSHCMIDVHLEDGASCTLVSDSSLPHAGWYFESVRFSQKRDTKSCYYMASKGGVGSRYDAVATLLAEGAETNLLGVHELKEKQQVHTHFLVNHLAPHCISNQKVKYGLFDASRSSFEGKIYVEKEAQKTEAYQLNNNLLLGSRAKAYSKPNLEIFADDVKASHGSTIGQLSEDELFYLQTRGLSKQQAEELLVRAFFEEMKNERPFS